MCRGWSGSFKDRWSGSSRGVQSLGWRNDRLGNPSIQEMAILVELDLDQNDGDMLLHDQTFILDNGEPFPGLVTLPLLHHSSYVGNYLGAGPERCGVRSSEASGMLTEIN